MSLIDDYVKNKENRLIRNLLRSGYPPQKLSEDCDVPLERVLEVEKTLNSKE